MAKKYSRAGLKKREDPKPKDDNGIYLDMELNDTDIWVVMVKGKRIIGGKSDIDKLPRPVRGKVLMRFEDKIGCKCTHFNHN